MPIPPDTANLHSDLYESGSLKTPNEGAPQIESTEDEPTPPRLQLHIFLFVTTLISVTLGYAAFTTATVDDKDLWGALVNTLFTPSRLAQGLPFSIPLMSILLAHEMGHYITARAQQVDQSLPYFIPAPGTFFGTFGAVILMRSQPPDRPSLLRVAVMGPYAGLLIAIPFAAWGLAHSTPIDPSTIASEGLWFGSSILFGWLETAFSPNGTDVYLHPVGMAGWVGLLVTTLNLIPAGQLDGGHVAYALVGRYHRWISRLVIVALLVTGIATGTNGGLIWVVWAGLLSIFGTGHPPVRDESIELTRAEKVNGLFAMVVFVITFIPVPIQQIGVGSEQPTQQSAPAIEEPLDRPTEQAPDQAEQFTP